MTGYTDNYDLPYPEPDTLISVSAPIVQELAEKIDAQLFTLFDGQPIAPSGEQLHNRDRTPPGILVDKITTSGTWTRPAGVQSGYVVVISGGGNGQPDQARWVWPVTGNTKSPVSDAGYAVTDQFSKGRGGNGGTCRVYRVEGFPATAEIVIGGPQGQSSFQGLPAQYQTPQRGYTMHPSNGFADVYDPQDWWPRYPLSVGGNYAVGVEMSDGTWGVESTGGWGVIIAGEGYCGGGGHKGNDGRDGGGWSGRRYAEGKGSSTPGTDGTGGGGGGPDTWNAGMAGTAAPGGSGVVLVFSDQTPTGRDAPPPPITPVIMAALNDGVMVGAYAMDPVAPVDTLGALVPYPAAPQPTGDTYADGNPVLAWPVAGWTYNDGEWSPPDD